MSAYGIDVSAHRTEPVHSGRRLAPSNNAVRGKGVGEPSFSEQEEPGLSAEAANCAAASVFPCEIKRCFSEKAEVPLCDPTLAETVSAPVFGESSIWASGGNKLGPGGKPSSTLCVPAASVLMGLMYGARMARYDLLRPVQSLASFLHHGIQSAMHGCCGWFHMSSRPYTFVRSDG